VTTATEDGVATPTTAAGAGVLAAELPPPQPLNRSAARAVNKEKVMVFTKMPPNAPHKFRIAVLAGRRGAAVWARLHVPESTDRSVIEDRKRFIAKSM
jgi:hypothetical protein